VLKELFSIKYWICIDKCNKYEKQNAARDVEKILVVFEHCF